MCLVPRRLQGSVHEPTSFQAPLLNRAGTPREGVSADCSWPILFERDVREVPELVAKFSKERLVAGSSVSVLVAQYRAMDGTTTRLLRSSIANIPCTAALSWMPSPLLWAGLEPSNYVGLVLQLSSV